METRLRDQLQATLGGAYTLERELGGGGMSRVFVAEEHALGRKVVVKVLPPELAAGVSVERFKREISFAAQLQHPHILPVLSAGETDGLPYYTMPLVEGESLRGYVAAEGPLPVSDAVHILSDVAKALAHAHARGVIHRDIKPDNVLMSGGAAVVTDFGVAKAIVSAKAEATRASNATMLTGIGMTMGTPTYMAPEQAAADPDADHRLDIYAFGCMAYELLAGQPPFTGRSVQALLTAHLSESPVPIDEHRDDLPESLGSLVMACLEKDPANRPQTSTDLVRALQDVSLGEAVGARGGRTSLSPASALVAFATGAGAVALVSKAAVVALALPDWVFTGTLVVLGLGFPPLLAAVVLNRNVRRGTAATTPSRTSGGASYPSTGSGAVRRRPWLSWQRAAAVAVLLVLAYATLVGGVVALGALGLGPARSLLAAGVLEDRARVLIADFAVSGTDTALGTVVTEAFRTDLAQSAVITIVPASAVRDGLARMQRASGGKLDAALARDLAIRDGIPAIVTGDITSLGSGYVLTARLVASESGDVLASVRETAADQAQLLPALDRLSQGLRERIGESMRTVRAKPPLAQVTTPSLEALRRYAQAVRLIDGEGDYTRGIPLLEEAVSIDTAFAMAYRKLAVSLGNIGVQFERSGELLSRAFIHRDRLTPLERHLTEGSYYGHPVALDRDRSIAAYRAVLEIDPNNSTAHNNIAGQYTARGDRERAAEHYRSAVSAEPDRASAWFNLVGAEAALGRLDEAQAVFDSARSRFPRHRLVIATTPMLAYYRFGADSAEVAFRRVRETTDVAPEVRVGSLFGLTSIAVLRGRFTEAERLVREAWAENARRGEPRVELAEEVSLAMLDIWYRDESERAIRRIDEALRRYPLNSHPVTRRPYHSVAFAYAAAGRPERARAILAAYAADSIHPQQRKAQESGVHRARAEIALAEQRPLDAIAELRLVDAGCRSCMGGEIGRAFDQAGMRDSTIANFEMYLSEFTPMRLDSDPTYLPIIYKRLGELYEERGDHARAREMYSQFVALWRNGDAVARAQVEVVQARIDRAPGPR